MGIKVNGVQVAGVGAPGKDGKSAYKYAKEGGYTGTEDEFRALMAGPIPVKHGGTGATDAAAARQNLGAAPAYEAGTTDLTAGTSPLDTGKLYFVYE